MPRHFFNLWIAARKDSSARRVGCDVSAAFVIEAGSRDECLSVE
jgi:hypothetical protein